MKKCLLVFLSVLLLFALETICLAGSVPEDLLHSDDALLFFGEVKDISSTSITVVQKKNVKGDFVQDRELTYPNDYIPTDARVGREYLCGYFDEHNPLYLWRVTSFDTKTLRILEDNDQAERLENYLNSGEFDVAERQRLAETGAEDSEQVALVGGADGPTSILVTSEFPLWVIGICIAIVAAVVLFFITKEK